MIAQTQTRAGSSGLLFFLVLVALALAAFAVAQAPAPARAPGAIAPPPASVIVDDYSHSELEHPLDQPVVRKCLDDPHTWKQDFRTTTSGRFLRVCWDDQRHIVFQVIDRVGQLLKEKTAYIRKDFHTPTDVVKYVERVGYSRIKGGLR